MRIFTRYILGEVASHAALGALLFTFVLFMRDLGRVLELVVRNSAPLPSVLEVFAFTLPNTLTVTLPMAVLVGILIGLSRLAADSEVTAMRASGMGVLSFVRIVALFTVVAWIASMANSLYLAPRSAQALASLEETLKTSQASFEVQPRVFYEDFKNYVLYVQDVKARAGAALWKNVFLADVSSPSYPKVTVARQAVVVSDDPHSLHMRLRDGAQHEGNPQQPSEYTISSFAETDMPIEVAPAPDDTRASRNDQPVAQISTRELRSLAAGGAHDGRARWYAIEFQRRLAYPTACLVLMLVGVPLGLSSRKGGKSTGFVLTILLVFVYYFFSSAGVALARQGKLSPTAGVWLANALFTLGGCLLLFRSSRSSVEVFSLAPLVEAVKARFKGRSDAASAFERRSSRRRTFSLGFPQILDEYVLRSFVGYFAMVMAAFVMLTLVFTFFELLGDIVRNRVSLLLVGDYLLNLTPSMVYQMAPLSVLIAVLVTFGLLQKFSELTAMRASGISIYRVVVPVLMVAALLAGTLFAFDDLYVPQANRRQEALRNQIKGKPAQTYLRPDRQWIYGSSRPGEPSHLYYYEFFDADHDRFANISVFEFAPGTVQLTRRIYAERARWSPELGRWVFEKGWERAFRGDAIAGYRPFDVATFSALAEPPGYFKREVRPSQEMGYAELHRYIRDLQASGFDVLRLRVQLYHKLAFPAITLVMAVLAVPFALSMGRRGALTGIAVAIGVAICYWVVSGLFEALGQISYLPALLAAWSPDILFGLVGGYLLLRVQT